MQAGPRAGAIGFCGPGRSRPVPFREGRRMNALLLQLSEVAECRLTDLLGSAGATVGIIIFGTIFLQFLSGKYTELASRFRELAVEYRKGGAGEARHAELQEQMVLYRRRLRLMRLASWVAAVALLCFLAAVL